MKRIRFITESAIIAAIYVIITALPVVSSFSFGAVQVRLAESLTVLPYFSLSAVPGLTIGCFIANMLLSPMPWDMFFGSIATLIAAICTYYIGRIQRPWSEYLAPLPPVVFNALIIGWQI